MDVTKLQPQPLTGGARAVGQIADLARAGDASERRKVNAYVAFPWEPITAAGGFSWAGSPHPPLAAFKDDTGMVTLRGALTFPATLTTPDNIALVLPADCVPSALYRFVITTTTPNSYNFEIRTNGNAYVVPGNASPGAVVGAINHVRYRVF